MNTKNVVVGIDTSNYTTSIGVVTVNGEVLANIKFPLQVRDGSCGLRQSDAVFAHIKNLPEAMNELRKCTEHNRIVAIGVSDKPRNVRGSYMPCFLTGVAAAESIAAGLGLNVYRFSHQCGHIMAALYSSGAMNIIDKPFAAFHVSGGTTELVSVRASEDGFITELAGESADLHAGQAIDRIGMMLGLPFPAGPHLEKIAKEYDGEIPNRKPSVIGTVANISGLENLAEKLYKKTGNAGAVSMFTLHYIAKTLSAMRAGYIEQYGKMPFVFAGGVCSNSIIKKLLTASDKNSYFGTPEFSADNAVGIALLALKIHKRKE